MEAALSLNHEDMTVKVNGMMSISGQYNGFQEFLHNFLASLSSLFTNFKVEPKTIFAEDGNIFTLCDISGDGFAFTGCHYTFVENEKVKEFHIFGIHKISLMQLKLYKKSSDEPWVNSRSIRLSLETGGCFRPS